jgi:lipopolysaccharide O-acetyltransferase
MRRPLRIRGRRWVSLGPNFTSGPGLRIDAFGDDSTSGIIIDIGSDVTLNDYVHIGAVDSIKIGNRVLIASRVFITDHSHGSYGRGGVHTDPRVAPGERLLSASPVVIEDDVWLGEFVSVLAGVRIGQGSIIGTMSTVTRDIPPYCIAVGSPARVIKVCFFLKLIRAGAYYQPEQFFFIFIYILNHKRARLAASSLDRRTLLTRRMRNVNPWRAGPRGRRAAA